MKKLLFSLIIISLAGLPVFAQVEVDWEATGGMFFDFENDTSLWTAFPDYTPVEFYIDENPDPTGINPSDSVGVYLTTDGCTWEGCYSDTKFKAIDFATYPIIKAKVWAPTDGLIFMVKVEDYEDNTNSRMEVQATTTTGSEWEELSYDFSAAAATGVDYERVVLFPDFNSNQDVDEWFFDDVRLDGVPPVSAVKQEPKQAGAFLMATNYPNPFNPRTTIEYTLPGQADVTLKIYDAIGNEVGVLVKENQNAGTYTVPFDGSELASGIYFYRLEAGHNVFTQKMVLMK